MNADSLGSLPYFLVFGLPFYRIMKKGGCGMHPHGGDDALSGDGAR